MHRDQKSDVVAIYASHFSKVLVAINDLHVSNGHVSQWLSINNWDMPDTHTHTLHTFTLANLFGKEPGTSWLGLLV